jgi:alpha-D-xyloside xylohydrolase
VMNSENKRDIYLPDGIWVNLFSGEILEGTHWIKDFECPLEEMPVWVKYGSEMPVYPFPVSNTDEMDLSKAVLLKFDEDYLGITDFFIGNIWK